MTEPKIIPPTFQAQQTAIASYNWEDLTSRLGYIDFLAVGTTSNNSGISYILTNQVISGGTTSIVNESGSTELNFDTSVFNLPATIKGDCYIHVPSSIINDTATTQTETAIVTVVLYLVDAVGTETSLGTDFFSHSGSLGIGSSSYADILFKLPIASTHIKIGEKLRLSVTTNLTEGGGDSGLTFDPLDAGTTFQSSQLKISVPFKIEI